MKTLNRWLPATMSLLCVATALLCYACGHYGAAAIWSFDAGLWIGDAVDAFTKDDDAGDDAAPFDDDLRGVICFDPEGGFHVEHN